MATLYMGADPENTAKHVLFSGDPWRVNIIKKYLDDVKDVAFLREFNTSTGTYRGVRITVTSTGIGSPGAAIAMEEMYQCGMETAVRIGTVMALDDDMLGHFIVPVGAIRREGTSKTYVEEAYPAVADIDLVNAINKTIFSFGKRCNNGISCTMDGFYRSMHESRFSLEQNISMKEVFVQLKRIGVSGIDMESACMFTVGRLMGVKTAAITVATVLENLKEKLAGEERRNAEDLLCRVALESIFNYVNEPPRPEIKSAVRRSIP